MKYMHKLLLATVIFTVANSAAGTSQDIIDLSGQWNVELPGDAKDGIINLPGTTDMAGYGYETDTLALSRDEQFRRLTRRYSYIGGAVYSREIDIPKDMAEKPLELSLERVLWKSSAKIDGKKFDNTEYSLVSPHVHVLPQGLSAGKHLLEIEIDNSKQYDISTNNLAHAYTNDTQTMWNGILGDITLRALPDYEVSRVEVYPAADLSSVRLAAYITNYSDRTRKENVSFAAGNRSVTKKVNLKPGVNIVEETLDASGLERWSEFNPKLYTATVSAGKSNPRETVFGMRSIDNKNGLRINGNPVFLRGTLECCVFPLTGVPPTDTAGWKKTFENSRRWGLNHLRFHSWCPPEAAFSVADSLGFYLQVELPVWSLKIGDDPAVENFLKDEYERIVREYGNHPSLCLISVGNELQHDFDWLNGMVKDMKARDPRHLYTTTSFTFEKGHGGHPEPEDQYFITQWTDNGWVRGQGVFETDAPSFNRNYDTAMKGINVPLVSHEIGQYAVYPSMKEIDKYTGILNPLNFKNVRKDLEAKRMLSYSDSMTMASAKFAALLYKEEIERALKTKGMSGFQLLGLQDFPGQGTALVGLVDAFWDNKGAVSENWFREFCSPVIPLLNFDKAVYRNSETFNALMLLANYSGKPLAPQSAEWSLTIEGESSPFASGTIDTGNVEIGKTSEIGHFETKLSQVSKPSAVDVCVRLADGSTNSWRIHVYPDMKPKIGEIVATRSLDEALSALAKGRRVLFAPAPDSIIGLESKFLPVFWSPVHFPKQAGTMGVMCDPDHPALKSFPNQGHSDWQWWSIAKNAKTVITDSLSGVQPVVRVIDNFVNNRKLAYIFEARCGKGLLLFSAVDILNPDIDSPELMALQSSLLDYMNSPEFSPSSILEENDLKGLVSSGKGNKTEHTTATSIYQ